MNKETTVISPNDVTVIDSDYKEEINKHFNQVPEVAKPLLKAAKSTLVTIKNTLYTLPAFIETIKAAVPETVLQAVLTDDQKQKIAEGALKIMTKKDGSLLATLIDPNTKKIITQVPLESLQITPNMPQAMANLTQSMTNFSMQMQMAQIAEDIQVVQKAIEEVRIGQEYDRLATAYSCQQKFLQAMEIKDPELKRMALILLAHSTEDSRNLLMLSQKTNVEFIINQPENNFGKFISGEKPEKIKNRISEIRESLCAINMVSLTGAMAYQELGEIESAKKSLTYYADFIENTYIAVPNFVQRLDMIDPAKEKYWSKTLPNISKKVKALSNVPDVKLLEN